MCGALTFPNECASFVHGSCGDNDIQACGLNDIFAVGKNDIALWATIFTLRVNGGGLGCMLCYTRRSALTRCTPGYWLTPAGGFGYACAHPGRGFSISLRSRTYLGDSGGHNAKRGGPQANFTLPRSGR